MIRPNLLLRLAFTDLSEYINDFPRVIVNNCDSEISPTVVIETNRPSESLKPRILMCSLVVG